MFYVTDAFLENVLTDDIPYGDLTTSLLGIENTRGSITCAPKADTVVAGVTLAARLFQKAGLACEVLCSEGQAVSAQTPVLIARGSAGAIHAVYKTAQTVMEYASGIATRTRSMVNEAHAANPACRIAVTRKHFPGTKTLSLFAALAGGAQVHRTGLSESVLVFDQHRVFVPNFETKLEALKSADPERKIAVEATGPEEGMRYAAHGADIIQCEKFAPDVLAGFIKNVKATHPFVLVSAAGGINASNAREYSATGADFLVTTWPYFGKPTDIKMTIDAE